MLEQINKLLREAKRATYQDLREFINDVEKLGELRSIDGADPHLEIGAITEVAAILIILERQRAVAHSRLVQIANGKRGSK